MKKIKISTIGFAPPRANADHTPQQAVEMMAVLLENQLGQIWPDAPDLVVLPEMCDRYEDFSPTQMRDYSNARGEQILERLAVQARQHNCYIAYPTLRVLGDGTLRNSVFLLGRRGEIAGFYDKNHVVISETTPGGVLPGGAANIIECDFGRVACAICFDLNFDELRLKYKVAKPDLILFPSMFHGGLMQEYWAYSCRAHFVSAIGFSGLRSAIISPVGQNLASTTIYQNFVTAGVNLDCVVAHLDFNRDKLRALKVKYRTQVIIADPDLLGSVLVSSENETLSAREMADEFEIELLDGYLARSLKHRCDAKQS